MIYRTLTDTELRRMLADPADSAATNEAARRFESGSDETLRLIAENERLESGLSAAEDRESEAWARVAELEGD